jgi:hypothetical protein
MELKPTQIAVLKVLAEHSDKRMGASDIKKFCSVSPINISNALRFLADHDLVYQPDFQGKVMIFPEGKEMILEYT